MKNKELAEILLKNPDNEVILYDRLEGVCFPLTKEEVRRYGKETQIG